MELNPYNRKRDFKKTPEPSGKIGRTGKNIFVIQKHDASHLHYDFRLELDGTLKSWAVPKGPSLDPGQKRLAMEVEDHPISYASFEGWIPKGEYGGGQVIVWDHGVWKPIGDPRAGLRKGSLEFELEGEKLHGRWKLFRIRKESGRAQWLLVKRTDASAHPSPDPHPITEERPESVISGELLVRDQEEGTRVVRKKPKFARAHIGKNKSRESKPKARSSAVKFIEPQLAQLVDEPPMGSDWIHEMKFDGYRTLCALSSRGGRNTTFFTRSGLDWTSKYESLLPALEQLPVRSVLLDGEIVVLDSHGVSEFQALQKALKTPGSLPLVYYIFDILEKDGRDLRELPLVERKSILRELMSHSSSRAIRFSDHWEGSAIEMLKQSCELGLEGIISKDRNAPYHSGRSDRWMKSKCRKGQEVILVGYTPPQGKREGFGALLMGAYEHGTLRYLGRVGTGFDQAKVAELMKRFARLRTRNSPLEEKVPGEKNVQWLKPELVAEIHFHGWTGDRLARQASFRALREDKPASDVQVEFEERAVAKKKKTTKPATPASDTNGGRLTNPNKVLIPDGGITKQMIRDYLLAVSDWILPHLKHRPIALLRCPDGTGNVCFFQKKPMPGLSDAIRESTVESPDGKSSEILSVDSQAGLAALAQMGVIEIHPWGTHADSALRPDLMVFDLDPDDKVSWKTIVQAALRLKEILEGVGLRSFVKVSGNKGLHLHVPILPRHSWEEVKNFSHAIALLLERENPELYIATASKAKRRGKIFIDYLRNGYGATSVAAYSLRAKHGGTVAMPIRWSELAKTRPDAFTLKRARELLKKRKPGSPDDPWAGYFDVHQGIPRFGKKRKKSARRGHSRATAHR